MLNISAQAANYKPVSYLSPIRTKPKLPDIEDFNKWKYSFYIRATSKGINKAVLDKYLNGITPNHSVIRLDKKQPEGSITFEKYQSNTVNKARIIAGQGLYYSNMGLLNEISAKYGVQPQYIIALWGMETNYGSYTGDFDIIRSLASLSFDGRRKEFFEKELIAALTILSDKKNGKNKLIGSWAGAMGQCQFMPSSYLKYAVDYDQDGITDIWTNKKDIFASIANYLRSEGWQENYGWGNEVYVPNPTAKIYKDVGNKKNRHIYKEPIFWQSIGINNIKESHTNLALIQPSEGDINKGYLITTNYNVLMHWNRSVFFATAVGRLADKIKEAY